MSTEDRNAVLIRQLQGAFGGNRFVVGIITAAGAVFRQYPPDSVTAARNAAGDYTVTFTQPFASAPVVVGMPGADAGDRTVKEYPAGGSVTASTARFQTLTAGAAADCSFHFVAIGPA